MGIALSRYPDSNAIFMVRNYISKFWHIMRWVNRSPEEPGGRWFRESLCKRRVATAVYADGQVGERYYHGDVDLTFLVCQKCQDKYVALQVAELRGELASL